MGRRFLATCTCLRLCITWIRRSPSRRAFFQQLRFGRLAGGKDGFYEYAHAAFGRIDTTDDAKTQRFVPGAFVENDGDQAHGQRPGPGQPGQLHVFGSRARRLV